MTEHHTSGDTHTHRQTDRSLERKTQTRRQRNTQSEKMSCCPPGSHPALTTKAEQPLAGKEVTCAKPDGSELVYYTVGDVSSAKGGVILVHDIWGMRGGRTRLIADHFAEAGYAVLVPDLFYNNDNIDEHGGLEGGGLMDWVKNFTPERFMADMETVRVAGFGSGFAKKVRLGHGSLLPYSNRGSSIRMVILMMYLPSSSVSIATGWPRRVLLGRIGRV